MKMRNIGAMVAAALLPVWAYSAGGGDTETTQRLGEAKHTLIEGIRQAEQTNGAAISAKFEFEDGKLWLSVYTARAGRMPDAEHNTLIELKGEPTAGTWKPAIEIFEDKEHLTRSAAQLTLMQLSKKSLPEIIADASARQKGTVYSAIPMLKDGKPVVVVKFALPGGETAAVDIPLR
jgi:hypothetical protein